MGCTQSKIENEESLRRCKDRKLCMKDAVASRNAFAAAHSAYSIALKSTGAALSDYGHGEAPDPLRPNPSLPSASAASTSAVAAAIVQPPIENLPPPPPPLGDFSHSSLQRSASMPDLPIPKIKKKPPVDAAIREEDGEDDDDDDDDDEDLEDIIVDAAPGVVGVGVGGSSSPPPSPLPPPRPVPRPAPSPSTPPPPPMPESKGMEDTWDYFFGMGADNMPVPSLSEPEDPPHPQINEIEDVNFKKSAVPPPMDETSIDEPPVTPEKVVVEPALPPKPVRKQKQQGGVAHHQYAASAGGSTAESKKGRMVPSTARSFSFLEILIDLDEHFLLAYQSAHEVSKMLEATRMHYHSNFADNRGHIDHSARVMRVITWNRSLKGIPNPDDGKDDFNSVEWETHATILDKMLAWEKKLYDEVKAGELMKIEYQRKVALLNRQKKRGVSHESLEKTKSAVSHLHTRYIVDMQSMDSTVSEINRLRDDRLYPKLVELVDGMANMWKTMCSHHDKQLNIVAGLRALDMHAAPKETTEQHHEQTNQLWEVLGQWHSHFEKLMSHHKSYIGSLNSWLKLNLIPIESSLKEKVSSPPRLAQPPIQALLHAWHDHMERLPDALARGAMNSFAEVVHTIVIHQEEELKHRETCEKMRREYLRESRAFEDWHRRYMQKAEKSAAAAAEPTERGEGTEQSDPVEERRVAVEAVKARLESEVENHQRMCKQVREKSLGSLKTHLPELFRALSDFARASSEMYKKLRSMVQSENPEE